MDLFKDTYNLALEHWMLTTVVVVVTYTYWHYVSTFTSLKKLGFKGPTPWPIIGNSFDMLRGVPFHDIFTKMGKIYGKVYGFYFLKIPTIVISDPVILKAILVKDFDKFHDRPMGDFVFPDPLSDMLTVVEGQKWKNIRSILTPMFTSGKMKQMMFIMQEASDTLLKKFEMVANKEKAIDIHDWQQGVTMEVILSSAFGLKTNSQTNPNDKMTAMARQAMDEKPWPTIAMMIPLVGKYIAQQLMKTTRFGFGWYPLIDVAKSIIEQRRRKQDKGQRRDMVTLLLESQTPEAEAKGRELTDNEVIAQMVIFILAGYDTSSNILGLTCYNLAVFPEAQERVVEEIKQVCSSTDTVTYDEIQMMPYLEACIAETLRLYPPGFVLSRKVTESCTISNIPFHKGTAVFVPVYTMHHDAEYWPEPEAFKPERFLPENKESITPFTYMPFGDGPRSCVAMRFAYMEMKTVLVRVLQKYRFVRGPETSVPIKVKPRAVLAPGEPVLVRVEKRDD